jgi:hypothetical protein
MRRQQLAQLRRLVWFAQDDLLDALGEAQRAQRAQHAAVLRGQDRPRLSGPGAGAAEGEGSGEQGLQRTASFLVLPLGGGRGGGSGAAAPGGGGGGGGASLQLHMCSAALLEELLDGARFSRAAYGYVVAAGHMSSITGALKMLATMPLFDPITGAAPREGTGPRARWVCTGAMPHRSRENGAANCWSGLKRTRRPLNALPALLSARAALQACRSRPTCRPCCRCRASPQRTSLKRSGPSPTSSPATTSPWTGARSASWSLSEAASRWARSCLCLGVGVGLPGAPSGELAAAHAAGSRLAA